MVIKIPKIDEIPIEQQTPLVLMLLESLNALAEENQALRDEIPILKGEKARPKIKPSSIEGRGSNNSDSSKKRPGSAKPKKTKTLEIHETIKVPPENLP